MTHTGMFIAALMAFVWGWLVYLRNRNHQEALRRREDERKRNQLIRLRVLENAKQEYTALLRRLGVSDRWFRHAWPLTQLSIIGAGPTGSLCTAIPAALRNASADLSLNGVDNFSCGGIGDAVPPLPPGLMLHMTSRGTETCPSFFIDGCGEKTRPGLWHSEFRRVLMPTGQERVEILLQGTRHTPAETLSYYLCEIAGLLENGKADGVEHDDDSGWAFRTFTNAVASAGHN